MKPTQFSIYLLAFFVISLMYGCAGTPGTSIHSNPSGAFVEVNGMNVGPTPVTYDFEWEFTPNYMVKATKEGYVDWEETIYKNNIKKKNLQIILKPDPSYGVTSGSQATNKWLRIPTNKDLEPSDLWQKIVDSVTSNYDSLEQVDSESGYMRSIYKTQTFEMGGGETLIIRTQFICAVADRSPLVYKVKISSQKFESATAGIRDLDNIPEMMWKPHNRVFKTDKDMLEEMLHRLQ
ncbi:MAG: PEGA domain-containing protein [Candidatus Electrothrix sp. ATG1]|nr:PEGA domain-containing protein [Candidatus Electrothrix sp. ATG1]